nr:MAG TPA: hypothetical protein [Caudoviricetes sp.]
MLDTLAYPYSIACTFLPLLYFVVVYSYYSIVFINVKLFYKRL